MTAFDARGPAPRNRMAGVPMVVAAVIVTYLIVMFIAWEMAAEIPFTTPLLPDQVSGSATPPVTTAGR